MRTAVVFGLPTWGLATYIAKTRIRAWLGLATYILAAQGEGGAADLALSRLTRGLEVLGYFELLPDNNRREHSKSAHQKDQVGEER